MRPWSRNEPIGVDMSDTAQFEGRTAEEAVSRARAALGDAGALRCWKTRRGGVGGFFAREVFVASLTPPPGSEAARGRATRAEPDKKSRVRRRNPVVDGTKSNSVLDPIGREDEEQPVWPEDHLFGLVEATSDQVSLQSLRIPDEAFDEVLAEAQAALAREAGANEVSTPLPPAAPEPLAPATDQAGVEDQPEPATEEVEVRPDLPSDAVVTSPEQPHGMEPRATSDVVAAMAGPARKMPRAKPQARPRPPTRQSTATRRPEQEHRPARVPDLRPGLRGLGVPDSFLPRGRRPSLDQLAGALETLPTPPPTPTRAGTVVAIVGSDHDVERTVDVVLQRLSLNRRDVVQSGDPASTDGPRRGRQIARRRASGRASLVAVHAAPGAPLRPEICELLDQAAPDYVLAAVGAHCKRVDVEHWINGLLPVDALALWDLSSTRTPAELLGLVPIAFVDGRECSTLGWTLLLAARALEEAR